jgi:beta-galactosidase GanA
VRSANPTGHVMTHVALSGFTGQLATHSLDEFTLTDPIDLFGTSSFPTWLMADDHVEHLFNLDTARDAARGKPFWQAELQGGRGRRDGLASTGQPAPEIVSLWMWNALAAGATGVMFWQWRPELLGPESPGYGLCAPDGSITERVAAVTRFARVASLAQLHGRVPERSSIGLLVSRKTALHAFATDRTMALYRDAVMGAYRLLTDQDVAVTILHEDDVARGGVPSHIRAIYWPMPSVASGDLIAGLSKFVTDGGRLVAEAGPGEYDQTGHRRPSVPAGELERVFGRRQHETTRPSVSERIDFGRRQVSVAWQVESTELTGAQVTGTFEDGSSAVSAHTYGSGLGILISTYPSLAYTAEPDPETAESIVEMLGIEVAGGAVRWQTKDVGLVTRRASTADGSQLVFAINWTNRDAPLTGTGGGEVIASTMDGVVSVEDPVPAKSAVLILVRD